MFIISWILIAIFIKKIDLKFIIYFIISGFIFLANILIFWVIFFLNLNLIKKETKKLYGRNMFGLIFITPNKRLIPIYKKINDDGITVNLDDKHLYLIEEKALLFDEAGYPCSFYFPDIPNPLILTPHKAIKSFFTEMMTQFNTNDKINNIILENDISFSSENLQIFKKNNVLKDINANDDSIPLSLFNKLLIVFGVIIGIVVLGFIIAMSIIGG